MKIPPTLGRYEVIELIGQGGMGALYRARDPRIGRFVAIKLLRPGYDTPELRDRFSREARAAGSLSHPNIVTIYDVGEYDGLPFIAMEYVRGETFADLVCLRPPLSVQRKVQLTEEVCAGLAHAHEAGIVHRDIKPANLIVGSEGIVKILDFGIAKLSATGITLPGAILGTLNYMSPEQIKGAAVDARADIFSVGAVLYELLSHQRAFPGEVPEEVLHRILNGVPKPLTEYCPDLDPRLVRLVDRALEKDPYERFQSIAVVQRELASIRLSPQAAVITPTPPRKTPPPAPPPARKTASPVVQDLAALRARQIEEHLVAAQRAFESADYDAAIESCKQVLLLDASEERAISQIDRIHAAIDEQQTAIRLTIEHAQAEYDEGNLTSALRDVKQVLALDRHNAEAQALEVAAEAAIKERQEEARIRAAVDEARRRFGHGEHQAALQSLEALQPTANALVADTLEDLRLALRQIEEERRVEQERRRRIAALLADARAALKDHRLDEASQALEQVREIDATVPELPDLTARVQRAQAAARLKEELERTLGEFEEQLTQGDLSRAGDLLKAAVALAPADSQVRSARRRLEDATAALAAREAAEARRREGEQKVEEAAACLEKGDLAGAADLLKLAVELVPKHPRAAELSEQLRAAVARKEAEEAAERLRRQVEELIRSATERLQSADESESDLPVALREVTQALALDPGNADAPTLKTAIEESIAARRETARVRALINNARRRFANGKHQAALKLLEDYQPSSRPEIAETLSELRGALQKIEDERRAERERIERQQRVAALLAEARVALRDQRFDAALGLLSNVSEIDAAVPELSDLTEQVNREQAAASRRAEMERTLADLDDSLTRGELTAASDLLSAAALDPADARVQAARRRVEEAIAAREAAEARAREIEEKTTAAQELFERGDLQGAMQLLTAAAKLDPQDPRTVLLSERVEEAIAKQEAADAAERLRRTVDELVAAAAQLLESADHQAHDVMVAQQKITQALALAPGHAEAQALKVRAEEAFAKQREAAFVAAAIRNARSRFANGKHQAALQLLESLDSPAHPVVADTLQELRAALHEIQERQRAEQELAERQRLAQPEETAKLSVPVRRADTKRRSADDVDVPSIAPPAQNLKDGGREPLRTDTQTPAQIQRLEALARWRWALIIGVGVLLLLILAALFHLGRPSDATAPRGPLPPPSGVGGQRRGSEVPRFRSSEVRTLELWNPGAPEPRRGRV